MAKKADVKVKVDGKVTRSMYLDESLVIEVEESSQKDGDKNFNREIIRLVNAQLAYEKSKKK